MKYTFFTLIIIAALSTVADAQSIQLVKSFENIDSLPKYHNRYVEFNNKLYFTSGNYLWVSDGTSSGTNTVYRFKKSIYSTVNGLTVINNQLIFMADDSVHGWEVWVSDGTTQGTNLLTDINPGPGRGVVGRFLNSDNYENNITKANNSIYFYGSDGQNGVELWSSDGTVTGTFMVADINTSVQKDIIDTPAMGNMLATPNNKIFFLADDSLHGLELWVSDGTASGTKLIKDVLPGKSGTYSLILPYKNNVLYNAGGLNITDGDSTFNIGNIIIASSDIIEHNNQALFFGIIPGQGKGLITTDGTASNTKMIRKIEGWDHAYNYRKIFLTKYNNEVYFSGKNPDSSAETGLWKTDGTTAGTKLIYATDGQPVGLVDVNGKLYFKTQHPTTYEVDVWESDGTSAGTRQTQNSYAKPTGGSMAIAFFLIHGNITSFQKQPYFIHLYIVPNSRAGLYRIGEPDNVKTIESPTTISIYPNPTQTELTISARDIASLSISNIAGMVVHREDVSSDNVVINTCNWTPGIYIATIRTVNGQSIHRKIIKE